MSDDKPSKAQQLVDMNRERRARGFKQKKAERVSLLISKDRAIRTEPVSARKDPDLRAKQIQEKKEEETRRLAKIAKDKIFNREVAEKKALAEANRQKAAADKIEAEEELKRVTEQNRLDAIQAEADALIAESETDEAKAKQEAANIKGALPNTATVAAQKLADEQDPPIDIQSLDGGIDNRINLGEVKAAIALKK